jgi:hypothetical protein
MNPQQSDQQASVLGGIVQTILELLKDPTKVPEGFSAATPLCRGTAGQ